MSDERFIRGGEAFAELRLPIPSKCWDWLYVGFFDTGLRGICNLGALLSATIGRFGRSAVQLGPVIVDGQATGTHVLIQPDLQSLADFVHPMMELHMNNENISDQSFWEEAERWVQRRWAEMSIADRIDWVKNAGDPPELVLEETIPSDSNVWTELYRDLDI